MYTVIYSVYNRNKLSVNKGKNAIPQKGFRRGAHLPFYGRRSRRYGRWINHRVRDAWPVRRQTFTVTFPAAEHHRPLTGTKLYCLVNRGTLRLSYMPRVVTWQCIR